AITWLFVSTAPLAEITMPVPAARPPSSVVLMLTIAGVTLLATALASSGPDVELLPPLPLLMLPFPVPVVGDGGELKPLLPVPLADELGESLCTATATSAPMPADASTSAIAAMSATTRLAGDDCGDCCGAGHWPG